jgi:hypothetical protein
MLNKKSVVYLSEISDKLTNDYKGTDFVRSFMQILSDKKFAMVKGAKQNPAFKLLGSYDAALELAKETYKEAEGEQLPASAQDYYEKYGFDKLVSSVSKWINYKDVTEREYDIDRLWLMRYIDFLDKAKERITWLKADQSLALRQLEEMKKAMRKK